MGGAFKAGCRYADRGAAAAPARCAGGSRAKPGRRAAASTRPRRAAPGVATGFAREPPAHRAGAANPSGNGNTVSLTASVPLFLGHAYEGEIARAMADWQQAQDQEAQVREAARALIDQTRAEWLSARQRVRLAQDELLPASERLATAAEAAWARGGSSLLELIEARRALRAARLEALAARADAAKAAWRWQSLDTPAP